MYDFAWCEHCCWSCLQVALVSFGVNLKPKAIQQTFQLFHVWMLKAMLKAQFQFFGVKSSGTRCSGPFPQYPKRLYLTMPWLALPKMPSYPWCLDKPFAKYPLTLLPIVPWQDFCKVSCQTLHAMPIQASATMLLAFFTYNHPIRPLTTIYPISGENGAMLWTLPQSGSRNGGGSEMVVCLAVPTPSSPPWCTPHHHPGSLHLSLGSL